MAECIRCLFNSDDVKYIKFDETGLCNYCRLFDSMDKQYPNDDVHGAAEINKMMEEIKKNRRRKSKYDCIIGVSGGCDSSYLLYLAVKKWGLTPLAVNFDNNWSTQVAYDNMKALCDGLGVDMEVYNVDKNEFDDILKAFLLSGVVDIDAATDIGLITALYRACEKHKVKYIVEGHSFRTEGVQPLNWAYVDGKYISDVHKKFGTIPIPSYPNLIFSHFLKWVAVNGIKRLRPLYYVDYRKPEAKKILSEYGWKDYGGHHLENKFTAFSYSYFLPRKAGIDGRKNELCAMLRTNIIEKSEAKELLSQPYEYNQEIIDEVKERLGFSDADLERIVNAPAKYYTDFKTYKKLFSATKFIWWLLYVSGRIPKSFYVKYCNKDMK